MTVNVHGFNPADGRDQHDVDEVVAQGGVFHLETMGDEHVWLGLYGQKDGRRASFSIIIENGKLVVRVQDDDRTADEKAGDKNTPAGGQWDAWHPMFDGGK